MTNFRYTVEIVEANPDDTYQGKRIRVIHHYREYPDSYIEEQIAKRAEELNREKERRELQAKILAAKESGATSYDLGNGIRIVWPNLVPIPEGVQPLSNFKPTLPTLVRLAL